MTTWMLRCRQKTSPDDEFIKGCRRKTSVDAGVGCELKGTKLVSTVLGAQPNNINVISFNLSYNLS